MIPACRGPNADSPRRCPSPSTRRTSGGTKPVSDTEDNGLALCSMHHKLLDLGAFTIGPRGVVLVSDRADTPRAIRLTLVTEGVECPDRPIPVGACLSWSPQVSRKR